MTALDPRPCPHAQGCPKFFFRAALPRRVEVMVVLMAVLMVVFTVVCGGEWWRGGVRFGQSDTECGSVVRHVGAPQCCVLP